MFKCFRTADSLIRVCCFSFRTEILKKKLSRIP